MQTKALGGVLLMVVGDACEPSSTPREAAPAEGNAATAGEAMTPTRRSTAAPSPAEKATPAAATPTVVSPPPAQPPSPAATPAPPDRESIGGVALGDPEARVVDSLGHPDHKGEVEVWEATGESVSSWAWKDEGVRLDMMKDEGGAFSVLAISLAAPAKVTTSRGVGIGASFAEVDRIYGPYRHLGREGDEPETWGADLIIVGTVYGGTFFTFTDGKVSEIFVGAGAE
jgi:hypothetical protein